MSYVCRVVISTYSSIVGTPGDTESRPFQPNARRPWFASAAACNASCHVRRRIHARHMRRRINACHVRRRIHASARP
jgi:hypothetical protein